MEVTDIEMTIGLGLTQDFTMEVQSVAETVTVIGVAPVVDTTKSEVSGVVTQQQIETLPINSRQYLSLALLMPGHEHGRDAVVLCDRQRRRVDDVQLAPATSSTASTNNLAEDGEPRQNLPEDAVQEFKVSNVQYKAEFGLATGGIVQVVTKSGTNIVHGTRVRVLPGQVAERPGRVRDREARVPAAPVRRQRRRSDRAQQDAFFGAVERTQIDEFYTVVTAAPQFYSALEGTFAKPFTRNLYFGRVDGTITNTQNVFARYAWEDELSTCNGCGGTVSSTAGFDQSTPRRATVLGHTWVRGSRQLNDFRFQYAKAAYYISPAGTEIWTDISVNTPERLNRLTQQLVFPSVTYGSSNDQIGPESRWQLKDTYAIAFPAHDVKFGVDISYMPYMYESTGNPLGTYTFSRDQFFDPNNPASVAALTGATTFAASLPPVTTEHPSKYYVGFVQDDWKLRNNLTVNLGLRYERLYGSANEDLDPSVFPIPIPYIDVSKRGDKNNFGPRAGLAWDIAGNGRTVVRGGYGLYYGHVRMLGQPQRVPELPAVQRQHHQPVVSGSVRRPRPPHVHRLGAGQHHRGGQRLRATVIAPVQCRCLTPADRRLRRSRRRGRHEHERRLQDRRHQRARGRGGRPARIRRLRAWTKTSRPARSAIGRSIRSSRSASAGATSSWSPIPTCTPRTTIRWAATWIRSIQPSTGGPPAASGAMRLSPAARCCCRGTSTSGPSGLPGRSCPGMPPPAAI